MDTTGLKNNNKYRVVVDTNVLVSAFLFGGIPLKVLIYIISSQNLILSDHIIDELIAYMKVVRPKIPQKFTRSLREQLQKYCYDYDELNLNLRDKKDNPIVELAYYQKSIILTGDKDILDSKLEINIPILSINEFVEIFL